MMVKYKSQGTDFISIWECPFFNVSVTSVVKRIAKKQIMYSKLDSFQWVAHDLEQGITVLLITFGCNDVIAELSIVKFVYSFRKVAMYKCNLSDKHIQIDYILFS